MPIDEPLSGSIGLIKRRSEAVGLTGVEGRDAASCLSSAGVFIGCGPKIYDDTWLNTQQSARSLDAASIADSFIGC